MKINFPTCFSPVGVGKFSVGAVNVELDLEKKVPKYLSGYT